jgi:hypothetical protein
VGWCVTGEEGEVCKSRASTAAAIRLARLMDLLFASSVTVNATSVWSFTVK